MSFAIAFVADTHLIADPLGQMPHPERARLSGSFFRFLIRSINAAAPDIIIHGGDVACGGHGFGATPDVFAASMARAKEIERGFTAPVYYTCGNHDIDPQSGSKQLFLNDFCPGSAAYHSVVIQDWRLIMLDSQDLPDDRVYGHIGDGQLRWLAAELATAANSGEQVLLFSHHPLVVTPDDLGVGCVIDNSDEVLSVLQGRENVVAVFSGHLHLNRIWKHDGIWQIWSAAIDSHPCSWREVTIAEGPADTQSVTIETHIVELTPEMTELSRVNLDHALRHLQEGNEADQACTIELGG